MGILKAEISLRIKEGIKEGIPATRLYRELRAVGPVTRKTDFLAEYRRQTKTAKVEGLLRFVRKDRYPTTAIMASLAPEASAEFLYQVKVQSVLRLGEPITKRFVNIMSDVPMTPVMIEAEVEERWQQWEKYAAEEITGLQVWSAFGKGVE